MGILSRENGCLEEAVTLGAQSLEFDPSAEKCIFVGELLEQLGSHAAALVYFRQARELNPCGQPALEALAKALDRRQEYEESSGVWARRLRLEASGSPRQLQLRLYWINALRLAGHLCSAEQTLSQARSLT